MPAAPNERETRRTWRLAASPFCASSSKVPRNTHDHSQTYSSTNVSKGPRSDNGSAAARFDDARVCRKIGRQTDLASVGSLRAERHRDEGLDAPGRWQGVRVHAHP